MNLISYSAILIFTCSLFKEAHQSCTLRSVRKYDYYRPGPRLYDINYVECEQTPLSQNLSKEISSLLPDIGGIGSLKINETNSLEIPPGIFKTFRNLPDLRINDAHVRIIQSGAFDGLLKLKQLSLKNNQIIQLNENCFNLTNLELLDLSSNSISDINENSFANLTSLKNLYLQNNSISTLPQNLFQNLTNVQVIDLSFNPLSNLANQLFKNLTNLSKLLLNNNNLHTFSGNVLSNNSRLETLYLNNNHLTTLTDLYFLNARLRLNISHNLVQNLVFTKPTKLQELDLSVNGILSLKDEFFNNLLVKDLYLNQNYLGLNRISRTVFHNLSNLETLSLDNNQITHLDPDVFRDTKLQELSLSNNQLSQPDLKLPTSLNTLTLSFNNFSSELNVTSLTQLYFLDLGHNNLRQISFHFLDNLDKLRVLKLNDNKISKLDNGAFRNLRRLNNLDISHNNISNINLGVFVGADLLDQLDLSHNSLSDIREGVFHNLKHLRVLKLSYNNLSFVSVEKTLSHITYLREIDLAGNNWPCSLLITLMRISTILLRPGNDYNVTNVKGIACRYEPKTPSDTVDLQKNFDRITSKINTNNNLLICIVIIIILALILQHVPSYLKRRKPISAKSDNLPLL